MQSQDHLAAPQSGRTSVEGGGNAPGAHTSGPWSFQASPAHGYRIRTTASTSNKRWGADDIAVVFFAGNGRSAEQCKADARLIAAAPDFYVAAQKAHDALTSAACYFTGNPQMRLLVREALSAVDAAIARATGEPQ